MTSFKRKIQDLYDEAIAEQEEEERVRKEMENEMQEEEAKRKKEDEDREYQEGYERILNLIEETAQKGVDTVELTPEDWETYSSALEDLGFTYYEEEIDKDGEPKMISLSIAVI